MFIRFIYFSLVLVISYPALSTYSPDDILSINSTDRIATLCKAVGESFTAEQRNRFLHNIALLPLKTHDDVEKMDGIAQNAASLTKSNKLNFDLEAREYFSRVSAQCYIRSALCTSKSHAFSVLKRLLGQKQVDLFRNNLLVLLQSHAFQPSPQTKAEITRALGKAEDLIANKIYKRGERTYEKIRAQKRREKKASMKKERRRFRKQMDSNNESSGESSPSPTKKRRTSSSKIIQETQEVS